MAQTKGELTKNQMGFGLNPLNHRTPNATRRPRVHSRTHGRARVEISTPQGHASTSHRIVTLTPRHRRRERKPPLVSPEHTGIGAISSIFPPELFSRESFTRAILRSHPKSTGNTTENSNPYPSLSSSPLDRLQRRSSNRPKPRSTSSSRRNKSHTGSENADH